MPLSRRQFIERSLASAVVGSIAIEAGSAKGRPTMQSSSHGSLPNYHRLPDNVTLYSEEGAYPLRLETNGKWVGSNMEITTTLKEDELSVALSAPKSTVKHVHLRWRGELDSVRLVLGDAWERGYGDLEWTVLDPSRVMPWYYAVWDGKATHCQGVRTSPKAFCFWQVDTEGISLWADVRSGGAGVQLGERTLHICDILIRDGKDGETPFAAIHAFCRQMCLHPLLPKEPVYGHNDWYYAYGKNSSKQILEDAHRIVSFSPTGKNRPFTVIDAGWQPPHGGCDGGVWDRGNEKFPDMPGLATDIKRAGAHPGIWIRPLCAASDTPDTWRLPRDRAYLDPTVPDALEKVAKDIARIHQWGFEMIKHDFSTADILGRWGFQMGATPTNDGWTFAEGPKRTSAEVIHELYQTIRHAAGDSLVLGCNTVSHLSAGLFELCRIGDDTSGQEWARTRKMGVNSLAFRCVQQTAFYTVDPDCVGVTNDIPWHYNRQWLDLVARSGTMLFLSLAPDAMNIEVERDVRNALEVAAKPQPLGEPLDWQQTLLPIKWKLMGNDTRYIWVGQEGVSPF